MGRISRLAITVTVAAVLSVGTGGMAASGETVSRAPGAATGYSVTGVLTAVAATSPGNAWAVGLNGSPSGPNGPEGTTLIVHWNGRSWSRETNPKPVKGFLLSVAAVSATDAWAVGGAPGGKCQACYATLIMHWNGKSWQRYTNAPVISGHLNSVTVSKYGVWAVGEATAGDIGSGLILRLIGTRWYVVPNPYPAIFADIAVAGPDSVWADAYENGSGLLAHWNGKTWKSVTLPPHGGHPVSLGAMASGPHGAVMMIGTESIAATGSEAPYSAVLSEGTWKALPAFAGGTSLNGVAFIPGKGAWAVGTVSTGPVGSAPVVLHWNGSAWIVVQSLRSLPDVGLDGIGGVSATDAWAVGSAEPAGTTEPSTVILHWNGHTWS